MKQRYSKRLRALTLIALTLCFAPSHLVSAKTNMRAATVAHKFYASLAQVDYNETTGSLEIALRIFADDLELALTKRNKRAVYLDKTPDAAALTLAYLQERFEVRNKAGAVKKLSWVGMETQVDSVWVYIEAKMPEGLTGASLRNRILFDLYDSQVNTVGVKYKSNKADLLFKPGDEDWKAIFVS